MSRVLITGATGFIGSHITRAFVAHGVKVGCLVRESSNLAGLEGVPVDLRYGDIRAKATLVDVFREYDAVIHNAALVGDWGEYKDYYQTNVLGALNVMEACRQCGIKNIVMAGSNAVYGEENCRTKKDEESPLRPHYRYFLGTAVPCRLNYYRDTKALATMKASEYARSFGLNLTILDPVWVYGERELHTGFYEYLRSVRDGMTVIPGCRRNKFHAIYAGDLAEAYYLAFAKGLTGVQRFLIGNQTADRMSRIFGLLCREARLAFPTNLPKFLFLSVRPAHGDRFKRPGSPAPSTPDPGKGQPLLRQHRVLRGKSKKGPRVRQQALRGGGRCKDRVLVPGQSPARKEGEKMIRPTNVTGLMKRVFNLRLKLAVLLHFIPGLKSGELSLSAFLLVMRRLLLFFSKVQDNKFVRIGRETRVDLYVPAFPSKAFFTACRKFATFGEKLPSTTVLISTTSACRYDCEHCYQKLDHGKDVDIEMLVHAVTRLQDMGVAFFNVEGGEPFLRFDRLRSVCAAIDERSEVWVNSTGDGMTLEKLEELRRLNLTAVMFSLHSPVPERFNAFLKSPRAWDTMINGVRLCHEAGILVAFNMCLDRADFSNGKFQQVMERARELGATIVQVIKPKPPAGGWRAAWKNSRLRTSWQ